MEEDIKLLEKFIDTNSGALKIWQISDISECENLRQAIENLINKYKEQKRDIRASHILLAKYSQKNEEQEKIIELMAKEMSEEDENFLYRNTSDIIDYFKKKARTSNETKNKR